MPPNILTGIVVSDKPNKTITVVVERKYQHTVLKKVIKAKKNIAYMIKIISSKWVTKLQLLNVSLTLKQKNLRL